MNTKDESAQTDSPDAASEDTKHSDPKEERIAELTETLQRLQAEFENFQKRTQKERDLSIQRGNRELLKKLLPTIDDFERALRHSADAGIDEEGIRHIFANLHSILEEEGVTKIPSHETTFNPAFHEALLVEATDDTKKDNVISEVFEEGYRHGDDVLRHAKVKVRRLATANTPKADTTSTPHDSTNTDKTK